MASIDNATSNLEYNIESGEITPKASAPPFPELLYQYSSGDTTPKASAPPFPMTNSSTEPTVTCLIIAHGIEENYNISSHSDKNIRVLSRAGVPGCLGTCGPGDYDDIFEEYGYKIDKRLSSYQKIEYIQQKFLSEQQCTMLYDTINREKYENSSGKYSLDIISKKGHSRIYKPFRDHSYAFTFPPEFKQGIHILEVNNPPPNSGLKYMDNLINKRFFLDEFNNPQQVRNNIGKTLKIFLDYIYFPIDIQIKTDYETIEDVTTNFIPQNEDEEEIKKMFLEGWVGNMRKIWKGGETKFFTPKNINKMLLMYADNVKTKKLDKLDKIFNNFLAYFEENNYNCENIFGLVYEIKNSYKEDQDNRTLIEKFYPKIFSTEAECFSFIIKVMNTSSDLYIKLNNDVYTGDINVNINMSSLIDYLKSRGYKIINFIDLSCRSVYEEQYEDKEIFNELREGENMGLEDPADLYDRNKGGTRKSKKFRKLRKTKKNKKSKKSTRKNPRNLR
jgi:hypothetical protein